MISIVCKNNFIDVIVQDRRAVQKKYRFFVNKRRGSVNIYTNDVKSGDEHHPNLDVEGVVCMFIFDMFRQEGLIRRLVVDTSKLTAINRKTELDSRWSLFFLRMRETLSHLSACVPVSRFEVTGHPLLYGIEVDAFWISLVPGTLKAFVHKGKSTSSFRGSLNFLAATEQWKKAQQVSSEFFSGIEVEHFCNLENVTVRMEQFSVNDFQRFISKITCSDLFSSCDIKIQPTGAIANNWMSDL